MGIWSLIFFFCMLDWWDWCGWGSKFSEKCCPWPRHLVCDLDKSDVGKGEGWDEKAKMKASGVYDLNFNVSFIQLCWPSEPFFYFLNFMSKFLLNVLYDTDSGIQFVSHILNLYETSSTKSFHFMAQFMDMYDICTDKKRVWSDM